ncbi:MAG TPA: MoxR family ATPase, partial [Pyrinomonadaceae bacterium]|nr:MoxR family ATPase [Pyrinomonadaceae bacterium]
APAPGRLSDEDFSLWERGEQTAPENYKPDEGLVDAVNVALLLGQPLLLTGAPGTGKTQLAYHVAWQLGFDPPLKFETKSTTVARELFYTFDTLARFHAAYTHQGSQDNLDYITYNALGVALLRTRPESEVRHLLPRRGFEHGGPRRSVVLVDEIDKAPRDFPNDILNEVEGMYFKIPELENAEVRADERLRPILILTSNSEKNLPDAFLRRCVYYDIPFPLEGRLKEIVRARIGRFRQAEPPWLGSAYKLFYYLRQPEHGLVKRPATAELLGWLNVLHELFRAEGVSPKELTAEHSKALEKSLVALVKLEADRTRAAALINIWFNRQEQ